MKFYKNIFPIVLTLITLTMPENTSAQETSEQIAEKAKIAKSKQEIAEAELKEAEAKKKKGALDDAPNEKEVAETNKAVAEAEKAAFEAKKAQLAGPSVTAPTGKITATGEFIESHILARKTLTAAAASLVATLSADDKFKDKDVQFVLYNQTDFTAVELYATVLAQVQGLEKEMVKTNAVIKAKIEGGPNKAALNPLLVGYAVSGVLRSAADIVSLFRTTTEFANFNIAVDEMALASALKSGFTSSPNAKTKTWKLFIPSMFPVSTITPLNNDPSAFLAAMNKVSTGDIIAKTRLKEIESEINQQTKALTDEEENLKKAGAAIKPGDNAGQIAHRKKLQEFEIKNKTVRSYIKELEGMGEHLKILTDAFTKLQNLLSTADATTKITAQAVIMRAERFTSLLKTANVYVIKLAAASKGSNKISENLWRNARIEHSAGTALECIVFSPTGEAIFTSNESNYILYLSPDKIN